MSVEGEINFFHPVAHYLYLSIQRLTTQLQSQAIASRLVTAHHGAPAVVLRALAGGLRGMLGHMNGTEE